MGRLVTLGLLENSKNSAFILESKMVKLNLKNSKQPDRPDAVRKRYFTLEIKE